MIRLLLSLCPQLWTNFFHSHKHQTNSGDGVPVDKAKAEVLKEKARSLSQSQ
jgi:hypothetical protein